MATFRDVLELSIGIAAGSPTRTATHVLDSTLLKTQNLIHSLDSDLLKTQQVSHVLDSTLVKTQSLTHILDGGSLLKTQTATHVLDSTLSLILSEEQEGFRWRADDGSESTATWLAIQDTSITRATLTNTRLRVLINATGDPDPAQYQLEYRKVGDTDWKKVNS